MPKGPEKKIILGIEEDLPRIEKNCRFRVTFKVMCNFAGRSARLQHKFGGQRLHTKSREKIIVDFHSGLKI